MEKRAYVFHLSIREKRDVLIVVLSVGDIDVNHAELSIRVKW